ncbi:cytochrome c3 family protein [Dethiobacter alkaliphilus]|uniref:cytochrome c3 family protein n=1 Tax=Dethiobacter alkaliphilus TaxID=427926 RepID=UPI00222697BB|nr:NapC/NirT family cytochrome c [Dethiobacter alkaliphilus]MCW3490125.1 NapC/NirT family cytochrome c [Dethiobacter alkaliphilus]
MKTVWKIILLVLGVAVGLYLLFTGVYYATYGAVGFCNRCHIIEPYVTSWEEQPHSEVNCMFCHEMRGFVGKLESQARGINNMYQFVTGQYSAPKEGRVFEQNCFSCHVGDFRQFPQAAKLIRGDKKHYEIIQENRSCLECHRDVGHGLNLLITPDFSGIR